MLIICSDSCVIKLILALQVNFISFVVCLKFILIMLVAVKSEFNFASKVIDVHLMCVVYFAAPQLIVIDDF